jgi:SAM-dependent methyltransferase
MKQSILSLNEVLAGYDAVSQLYPHTPPMSLWRAWEYAAYRRYALAEPVLDVGCGDGRFFRLMWPHVHDVTGVDISAAVVEAALQTGVYRTVHVVAAQQLPVPPERFASAFANCSLEHMDHLSEVLACIREAVRVGGFFLLSVVTEKFVEWAALPLLANLIGEPRRAHFLQAEYEDYHHLVNPLPVEVWVECLERAGFEVLDHTPIIPEMTSRLFLFLDHLWHVRSPTGELGDALHPYLATLPNFRQGLRQVLAGVLQLERNYSIGSGAVFCTRRSE